MYSYTPAGQIAQKKLRAAPMVTVQGQSGPVTEPVWADLDASWTYDIEGRVTSYSLPSISNGRGFFTSSGSTWFWGVTPSVPIAGAVYNQGYDTMGRPTTLAAQGGSTVISNVTYGPAGEMLTMSGVVNETRSYNNRLQLTGLNNGASNWTYTYPANQNNGKILQQTESISGEQITYQYDALNRLISAVTSDNPNVPQWGQSFNYDGFGNLTDKNVTKGSATALHVSFSAATNWQSGITYDANGNQLTDMQGNNTLSYDGANRLGAVAGR